MSRATDRSWGLAVAARAAACGFAALVLTDCGKVGSARVTAARTAITRPADDRVVEYGWGRLTWYASGDIGNSTSMTVGEAVIGPGRQNPSHYHPNCDEIVHVLQGHILQTFAEKSVELHAGDTVVIPAGVRHSARNLGSEDAVLFLSYSSAHRQVIAQEPGGPASGSLTQ